MSAPGRYAPPEDGLPVVESICANGHRPTGELFWLLPLVFPEDIPLTAKCPICGAEMRIEAGSYEPDEGVYRRTGPPDEAVVIPVTDG